MCAVHGRADRSSRRDLPRKCSDIHAWSCSPTVRARADAPASMCRPCTLCTRTPLAQDGRQVHTCRAESALDGHSGFDHAVMMSVQTKSRGQCGMRAPLHRCTALPPGSAHAAKRQNLPKCENISPREYLISTRSVGQLQSSLLQTRNQTMSGKRLAAPDDHILEIRTGTVAHSYGAWCTICFVGPRSASTIIYP